MEWLPIVLPIVINLLTQVLKLVVEKSTGHAPPPPTAPLTAMGLGTGIGLMGDLGNWSAGLLTDGWNWLVGMLCGLAAIGTNQIYHLALQPFVQGFTARWRRPRDTGASRT